MSVALLLNGLIGLVICKDATTVESFKWSDTYTLKAVLTMSEANISTPYQVWFNGKTGRSRVDYYGGLDQLYRQWNCIDKTFDYFKVHPDTSGKTDLKVCHKLSSSEPVTKMYALNAYLPNKPWAYVRSEKLNNVETQRYVYEHLLKVDKNTEANAIYTVWVIMKKNPEGTTAVPVKFVYELKYKTRILQMFRHDYLYFDDSEPTVQTLLIPLGMICTPINAALFQDPIDVLETFIDPNINQSKIENATERLKDQEKMYRTKKEQSKRFEQSQIPDYLRRLQLPQISPFPKHFKQKGFTHAC